MTTLSRPGAPTAPAQEFGAYLRAIRGSLGGDHGVSLTQAQLASMLLVGGKGVVSLFESGRRMPSEDVVRRYGDLPGVDTETLWSLRERALTSPVPTAPGDVVEEAAPAVGSSATRWWPTRRSVLIVGGTLLLAGAVSGAVALEATTQDSAEITSPRHETDAQTALVGTVHGMAGWDLWIDVQAIDETRHHPTEQPCDRSGDTFSFDEVYVGTSDAVGRTFRLSVLAVIRGSESERELMRYGMRAKSGSDVYQGLVSLPAGTRVMSSTMVRRR